jgi:hypothetical protein
LGRPMAAAIRFANVTAALSCRALDGRTGIPDRAEVDALVGALGDPRLSDREIAARFSNEDPA